MKQTVKRFLLVFIAAVMVLSSCMIPAFAASSDNIKYYVTVDRTNKIVTVYKLSDKSIVRQMLCTIGMEGRTVTGTYPMPKGENSYDRKDWYFFKGFHVYAKYPTRIFKGILFHSLTYNKQAEDQLARSAIQEYGTAASHGCVRLLVEDAKWIQDHCPIGTKVTIYDSGIVDENLRELLFIERYSIDSGISYEEFLGGAITQYSSEESVYKLQERLHELGYFTGEVDGKWGEDTSNALLAAEIALGCPITANVTSEFMERLNSEDAPVIAGYNFAEDMHEPGIKAVQKNLKALGLYTGDVDGIFDFDVSQAVSTFQSCYGYEPTGTPSVIEQEAMAYEAKNVVENCGKSYTAELVNQTVDTAIVNFNKGIKLRSEPNTDSHEVDSLKPGSRVIMVERGKDWSKVQYGSNVGYMKNKYLAESPFSFSYIKYNGANGSYTIGCTLEELQKGASFPCSAFESVYAGIVRERKDYIKKAAEEAANNKSSAYGNKNLIVKTGSDDITLRLREKPNTEANVITELKNGTDVIVLSTSDGWSKVNCDGQTGYVVSDYLSEDKQDYSYLTSVAPISATIATTEGFAYVYSDPEKSAKTHEYVTTGSTVKAYGSVNGYTYIEYTYVHIVKEKDHSRTVTEPEPHFGFVKSETLSATTVDFSVDASAVIDVSEEETMPANVIADIKEAPVFSAASEDSSIIEKIPGATPVTVLDMQEDSDWVHIQYSGNKTGYMHEQYLDIEIP